MPLLGMLEKISYDEDKTRPEVIRSAVKFLFLKKYGQKELEKIRKKHQRHFKSGVTYTIH